MELVTRQLTPDEESRIEALLTELRAHFRVWPTEPGKEWYLLDFAYNEGCGHRDQWCVDNLKECAPLALGRKLVFDHGFEWCMIKSKDTWRIGVSHSQIVEPIDLYRLEEEPLFDPDEHDDDTQPFNPGEGAHESIHAILRQIGQRAARE